MQLELFPKIKVEIKEEIDRYLIMFSGGKDSLFLLLWTLVATNHKYQFNLDR